MSIKHTNTPWRHNFFDRNTICSGDQTLARFDKLEDALFAVLACNAHDDLVKALIETTERLELLIAKDQHKLLDVAVVEKARTILAKLEN